MSRIDAEKLETFAHRLLEQVGATEEVASQVARSLVAADLRGHGTHGVFRIPWYVEGIEELDWINPNATPQIESESESTAIVDGNSTFGQVAGRVAVDVGIGKADRTGIGIVGVRDATHLGRIGEWAERVTDAGYLGTFQVATQGGSETVAPAGSGEPLYSTNPIAYGIPTFDVLEFALVLDIATSQVAHGKIRTLAEADRPIPEEWTTTETGHPVSDAKTFREGEGALLPLGGRASGYKGFGLAVMAELFASIIGDGYVSGQQDLERSQNIAAIYIIDPTQFTTEEEIKDRIRVFTERIRSASYSSEVPVGAGAKQERGLLPGEPEYKYRIDRERDGIPLAAETVATLHDLAIEYSIENASPF